MLDELDKKGHKDTLAVTLVMMLIYYLFLAYFCLGIIGHVQTYRQAVPYVHGVCIVNMAYISVCLMISLTSPKWAAKESRRQRKEIEKHGIDMRSYIVALIVITCCYIAAICIFVTELSLSIEARDAGWMRPAQGLGISGILYAAFLACMRIYKLSRVRRFTDA